jgi:hypothetical protein
MTYATSTRANCRRSVREECRLRWSMIGVINSAKVSASMLENCLTILGKPLLQRSNRARRKG